MLLPPLDSHSSPALNIALHLILIIALQWRSVQRRGGASLPVCQPNGDHRACLPTPLIPATFSAVSRKTSTTVYSFLHSSHKSWRVFLFSVLLYKVYTALECEFLTQFSYSKLSRECKLFVIHYWKFFLFHKSNNEKIFLLWRIGVNSKPTRYVVAKWLFNYVVYTEWDIMIYVVLLTSL